MNGPITLDTLENNLTFFKKMYDAVRLVDPVKKSVLDFRSRALGETREFCYQYWKSGKICDNCVSFRAYRDNESYIKLERTPDRIILVTAVPIQMESSSVVLELLKNATQSMIIGEGNYNEGMEASRFVSKLNGMLVRDALTPLYNRRFVEERLPVDIVQATIQAKPLSVIFMDIDNMKSINDRYGHPAGDRALKAVARVIGQCIRRSSDWAARYGGDEILICLNGTEKEAAYHTAERIRRRVERTAVRVGGEEFRVTVSMGVYTMLEERLTAGQLVELADREMYRAKRSGKNKTQDV